MAEKRLNLKAFFITALLAVTLPWSLLHAAGYGSGTYNTGEYGTGSESSGGDTTAPVVTLVAPDYGNSFSSTTDDVTIVVTTNEASTCKYDEHDDLAYASMTSTFTNTGGTSHSTVIDGVEKGEAYSYYVRCRDTSGNASASDTEVSFSIKNSSGGGGSSGGTRSPRPTATTPTTVPTTTVVPTTPAAPTATPSVPSAAFSENLSGGMTSESVRTLQKYLNTHGYPVATVGPGSASNETNVFGPATKAALIRFQIANNILPATGALGPQTRALLNSIMTSTAPVVTAPVPTTAVSVTPSVTAFTADVSSGTTSENVRTLQKYLNAHGYTVAASGPGSKGNETNVFGPATKAALINFQVEHGIFPNGILEAKTRTVIEALAAAETPSVPKPVIVPTTALVGSPVSVAAANVNVRTAPVSGEVITMLPLGTTGTVTLIASPWSKVRFSNGVEGWVYQPLLK